MMKNIYRIRLVALDKNAWKNFHNDDGRMRKIRKELWSKYAKLMEHFDYDKSKITPLFEQMEIDDRRYFEVQECAEKIDIQSLLPNINFKA